jgi:enoyl-CoA hydratase/carnithine racemase
MGLVTKALPKADVFPAALDMATEIAENCAPVSVALTKRLIWKMLEETDHSAAQALDGRLVRFHCRVIELDEIFEHFQLVVSLANRCNHCRTSVRIVIQGCDS